MFRWQPCWTAKDRKSVWASLKGRKGSFAGRQPVCADHRDLLGDDTIASITFKDLPRDVSKGDHILIDDGLIELLVEKVEDTRISCVVLNGGPISDRKGVNVRM